MKRPAAKAAALPTKSGRAPRKRVAVGPPRPRYLLNEENDRMMAIITALAAEVAALRDRLDTHEALAEKRRFPSARKIEKYRLDDARREAREQARQAMLSRVFRVLLEDLDSARQDTLQAGGDILAEEVALD